MAKSSRTIGDLGEKIGGARKDRAVSTGPRKPRPVAVDTDTRPAWARRFITMQNIKDGTWDLADTGKKGRFGGVQMVTRERFATEAEALARVPLAAVARNHRVSMASDGKFQIIRDVTDRKRVTIVQEKFDTREQAMNHLANNAEKIIETKIGFGEEILAKPEKVWRKGPDVRMGDIAGESFMKTLGMRGVEFGNWQGERQSVMNHAYDAFQDLSHVTGIEPKDLSLKSDLAIAFGARGNGLSSARAHYEPMRAAMNLTKLEGAGALAHEWWHGMDHLLGRVDDPKLTEQEVRAGAKTFKHHEGDHVFASHRVAGYSKGQLPDAVRAAYKDLVETIYRKPEQYVEDTQKVEKFASATETDLKAKLGYVRQNLAEKAPYGKRLTEPASAKTLAKFDKLAEKILAGEALKTEFKNVEGAKTRSRFSSAGYRHTNETLEEISKLYKEVRGRSGFDGQHNRGIMDDVSRAMRRHSERLALVKDAAESNVKTRMIPTDYAREAHRADERRVSDYWQTKHEMTARAFSAYVEDKLASANRQSDYLSYGSQNKFYVSNDIKPFPEGAERQAINAKFEALFDAMKRAEVVKAAAPTPTNMIAAMSRAVTQVAPVGKPAGWSDQARAASAEVRKSTSEWLDADKYREMPNGDRMVTKAFADAMRREAESLPSSDPTRSLKIEHAGIIEGTAWRKDGSAYVPALHEAAAADLKKQQADASAKTTRGKRSLQKAEKANPKYANPAKAKPAREPAVGDNGGPSEKAIRTAARLEAVAKATADKAEKIANQPRLMNTARRARLGGGVIEEAHAQKAHAETALKIAEALRNGEAGNLANIKSLADVRALNVLYRSAMHEADRVQKNSYQQGKVPTPADIEFAKLPQAYIRTTNSDIESFRKVLPKGFARDIAIIERHTQVADRGRTYGTRDEKVIEATKRVAKAVSEKGGRQEKWHANKILEEIRDYDRVKGLGIDSVDKLKAVLTDYVAVRQSKKTIDPATLAERDLIGRKLPGFFPTPASLASRMADMADIRSGMTVLEPSAGTGRLADAIKAKGADVHVVEMHSTLRDVLAKKGYNPVAHDFTSMEVAPKYDRIVMNPPFERGQDMAHVKQAYDMLKPGGKIVAIMGEGAFFRGDKTADGFRSWLADKGTSEKLPEGTFKESNTGVNTRLVTISKPHHAWDDAARAASAASRAANAAPVTETPAQTPAKPTVMSAVERAMARSQERAAPGQSTLAEPKVAATAALPVSSPAVSSADFMAQAEVRAHPDGGHEVKGPGTNGQWVRTSATGSATAAKMVAFSKHVSNGVNKLGVVGMIAAPATAAILAYDASNSQAKADGLSKQEVMTKSVQAALVAGGTSGAVIYGISKVFQGGMAIAAKVAPKIAPALGPAGLVIAGGFMAHGAYHGYKAHGLKGAALGAIGADGLLNRAPAIPATPAPVSPASPPQSGFAVANAAYKGMQNATEPGAPKGWANPIVQAKAQAAKGRTFSGFKSP